MGVERGTRRLEGGATWNLNIMVAGASELKHCGGGTAVLEAEVGRGRQVVVLGWG